MRYHHIQIKTNSSQKPDVFVGTALRGTFGHILKEYTCIEPSYDCETCAHQSSCLSYLFYPTKDKNYRTYRIQASIDPENYDFELYLFGDFSIYIRIILQALKKMLLSGRITSKHVSFPKAEILYNGKVLQFDKYGTLLSFDAQAQILIPQKKATHDVIITLRSPLHIKKQGKFRRDITLEVLLRSIYKRKIYYEKQEEVYDLLHTPSYTSVSAILHEREQSRGDRYSHKQNRSIPIEGMLGSITAKGLDQESYELLKWGEILGAGKGTALGGGSIKIEEVK